MFRSPSRTGSRPGRTGATVCTVRWRPLMIALWGCLVSTAAAQEPARLPNWEAIRKTSFETLDRRTVQQWAENEIRQLLAGRDTGEIQRAGAAFYNTITTNFRAADATSEFKNGLGEILAAAFIAHYKPSSLSEGGSRPLASSIVLMALRDIGHRAGLPAFRAGLGDATPGPRLIAAEGIIALRETLNDAEWSALLPDLQKAGAIETNGPTLSRIYRALFAENPARAEQAVPIVLAIMNARFKAFEEGRLLPVAADGEAAAWLADKAQRTGNAQLRIAISQHVGQLVVDLVDVYLSTRLQPAQEEQIERAMLAAEPALTAIVRSVNPGAAIPSPSLCEALLGPIRERESRIETALAQWVGAPENPGLLNQPPFNLPRGMDVKRRPHRDLTTAPAATEPAATEPVTEGPAGG